MRFAGPFDMRGNPDSYPFRIFWLPSKGERL
jgi:hypothetical protein